MALVIKDGDYLIDNGRIRSAGASEELLQRVLFKMIARRGKFVFCPQLGSRLWTLNAMTPASRQSVALQYVAEALADENDLRVKSVTTQDGADGKLTLTAEIDCGDENMTVTVDIG